MKCQICKDEEASWAWQPFGPGETPNEYALLGSHTRGFPAIKVGDVCKNAFQTGDFDVKFEYKGVHYIAKDHEVKEILSKADFWDGGTSTLSSGGNTSAVLLMKSDREESKLVAMVVEPEFVRLLCAAPELLAACEEIDAAFYTYGGALLTTQQKLAIAKASIALRAAKSEA